MRRHGSRTMVRPIAVAGACAALGLTAPAPAGAFLRDVETVVSQSAVSSDPVRTLRAGCPAGRVVLGGGASAFPASSGVTIPGVGLRHVLPPEQPPGTNPPALFGAVEADPVAASWGLFSQRFCATPTATAPTAATNGPYIKDVFVASTASAFNSTSPKTVSTACQGGRQSIGGGFAVGSHAVLRKTVVRRAVRVQGGFVVEAHETVPHGNSWGVTAFAVCANLGSVGTRQATYAGTRADRSAFAGLNINSPARSHSVHCPSGHFLVGGGAQVLGHTPTTPPPGDVVLLASYPQRTATGTVTWVASAVEENETPRNWNLEVRVVCARQRVL